MKASYQHATFAGGCFWCLVAPFEAIDGVINIVSGFTGGTVSNPSYEQVCAGQTGHFEAVHITFDPERTDYATLLHTFWLQIDPSDAGGSFYDRGQHYQSAVFYHDETQQQIAQKSILNLHENPKLKAKIATQLLAFSDFYPAEDYHQNYHHKNPSHYQRYRSGSGRDAFLQQLWSKENAE
ncbi:MAG: peptide-methionine (S)-S-oxide reductase MsrA [Mariprofundaceae bacterium]|nr:peptide-methionine (S)-S-oxide reductase MsrA [Mariprofundaceae bacterium]